MLALLGNNHSAQFFLYVGCTNTAIFWKILKYLQNECLFFIYFFYSKKFNWEKLF